MTSPLSEHSQLLYVSSFDELIKTPFRGKQNALCWQRDLEGNFKEIVDLLELEDDLTEISSEDLLALSLSEQGQKAREVILNDMHLLTEIGALPSLNLIRHYERDDELDFISTDVYSYHVDRSPIATDTFLCTYYGATSDIIPSDQVTQKILIPNIRDQLKQLHQGSEEEFEQFLMEYFFDLHYQPHEDATITSLKIGQLCRLAVDHPKQVVSPCVHRAPLEKNGEYRLLLIC